MAFFFAPTSRDTTASCLALFLVPFLPLFLVLLLTGHASVAIAGTGRPMQEHETTVADFVSTTCLDCHSGSEPSGALDLEPLATAAGPLDEAHVATWEAMVRRMRAGQMPPPEANRPHGDVAAHALASMEAVLAHRSATRPRPGRTETIRRLTRVQYGRAAGDLLGLDVDATKLLPKDESSGGFDNITVSGLSPMRLTRYVTAAETLSRRALGRIEGQTDGVTYRVAPDRTQERHIEGLPLGTRGGAVFEHQFPRPGRYAVRIKLSRDRDEKVEGLDASHELDLLLDRRRVERFAVHPPKKVSGWLDDYSQSDAHLSTTIDVTAGPHSVGVAFLPRSESLREIKRQPFEASYNRHRHPRRSPALFELSIVGPLEESQEDATRSAGDTPSRRHLFGDLDPVDTADYGREQAEAIVSRLARRAFRRPVTDSERQRLLAFYDTAAETASGHDFEAGLEHAVAAVLVNPAFLLRVERQPEDAKSGQAYELDAGTLASRLSFFLWSSIPDGPLLEAAESGELMTEAGLRSQARRMLADERSIALVEDFASQWLYLRNLAAVTPDLRLFPSFDDNLRHAMRRETELLLAEIVAEDRPITDLLDADFTYLNERLAIHYGRRDIKGSHFRRVSLPPGSRRGGLLRQASILTVTSYATRTSPTIRGNWVLTNILGTPAPPPPPNVPALKDREQADAATVRERLAQHRDDPACAGCHDLMDPIGFALDRYDAVGRWRQFDGELPVDTAGILPDGQPVQSVADVEAAILSRPDVFATALTEKLLTYALGRMLSPDDGPAVRAIVRQAAANDYRFSSIVLGIVTSSPFRMRQAR